MDVKWGEGTARLVLASALKGNLLARLPGAFSPELFNPASGAPAWKIATFIADFAERYNSPPPVEYIGDLVKGENDAVQEEWQAVQYVDLPENPDFIETQVREAVEYRRMEQALLAARLVLEAKGGSGLADVREALSKAESVTLADDRRSTIGFVTDIQERVDLWSQGDEMGERIPTGLPALDVALGGGPTRKETWYYLAPPKGGKTAFLLRTARGASLRGFGVYLATFEMQAIRMLLRLDRMSSRSTKEELSGGDLTRLRKAVEGMRASGAGEIYVQERRTQEKNSVQNVGREVERIRREGGKIDAVIFDYLNIMGSTKSEREKRFELSAISREMSDLAKDLDVVIWSAALATRAATEKSPIRKTDIGESFEVIAVADGVVAICAPPVLIQNKVRRLWVAAAREEGDEVLGGDYVVDFARMVIEPTDSASVDALLATAAAARRQRRGTEESAA